MLHMYKKTVIAILLVASPITITGMDRNTTGYIGRRQETKVLCCCAAMFLTVLTANTLNGGLPSVEMTHPVASTAPAAPIGVRMPSVVSLAYKTSGRKSLRIGAGQAVTIGEGATMKIHGKKQKTD